MSVESKIKLRIFLFLAAAIILLAWIVGIVYALSIALLAFILWKAYSYIKMMRWWKGESAVSRKMIEYVTERLNEGKRSNNLWVQSLIVPEATKLALDYRVELMARPKMIEKESPNVVEGWTGWGGTRLQDCVLQHSVEELAANMGSDENPLPMLKLMIAKAAFEILVAEHALKLLNVPNPRELISQRTLSKELENLNTQDSLTRTFNSDKSSTVFRLLAQELGEQSEASVSQA